MMTTISCENKTRLRLKRMFLDKTMDEALNILMDSYEQTDDEL